MVSDMAPEAPKLEEGKGTFVYIKTDVTNPDDVDTMVKKTQGILEA